MNWGVFANLVLAVFWDKVLFFVRYYFTFYASVIGTSSAIEHCFTFWPPCVVTIFATCVFSHMHQAMYKTITIFRLVRWPPPT